MTIRKGVAWGEPGRLGGGGVIISNDAQGARVIAEAMSRGDTLPELGLIGGDLCTTLGGSHNEAHLFSDDAHRFPIDLGVATLDGSTHYFLAHGVARRRWWRGHVVAAMNAQWLGSWDVGPKSHPNDGLLDISDGELRFTERMDARKRLPLGTHVPHPKIHVKRTDQASFTFDRPIPVYLDSEFVQRCVEFRVSVIPDALVVVI